MEVKVNLFWKMGRYQGMRNQGDRYKIVSSEISLLQDSKEHLVARGKLRYIFTLVKLSFLTTRNLIFEEPDHWNHLKYEQVKEIMERILMNLHAELASDSLMSVGRWYMYLPLFAVYIPKKPISVRIVFDSSV